MDRTLTYTVADLASDEAVRLRCDCRVRTYGRAELAALVGRDARLHLIGLRKELWCGACGEAPFTGWVVAASAVAEAGEHGPKLSSSSAHGLSGSS